MKVAGLAAENREEIKADAGCTVKEVDLASENKDSVKADAEGWQEEKIQHREK